MPRVSFSLGKYQLTYNLFLYCRPRTERKVAVSHKIYALNNLLALVNWVRESGGNTEVQGKNTTTKSGVSGVRNSLSKTTSIAHPFSWGGGGGEAGPLLGFLTLYDCAREDLGSRPSFLKAGFH